MIVYVIATKRRTCDETSKTKQKTNITGELFFKIPLQTKGEFFYTDSVRKDAFFIPKRRQEKYNSSKTSNITEETRKLK